MTVSFTWNKPVGQIIEETVGKDQVSLFMANQARTLMAPYVPARPGSGAHLVDFVEVYVKNGQGIVEYKSPYARYQFGGVLFVSSRTGSSYAKLGEYKVPTGKRLRYSTFSHPLATSHWDKAMMTARGADLAKAVQNFIKQKGG